MLEANPHAAQGIDELHWTLLMHAANENQFGICRKLISLNADPDAATPSGLTALHLISRCTKAAAIARMLLSEKANPNMTSSLGMTPLTEAVSAGNRDLANVLLREGKARVDRATILAALAKGAEEVIHVLIENTAIYEMDAGLLVDAVQVTSNAKHIAWLCDAKADLESEDEFGWTPILHAASRGYTNVCLELLHRNAVVTATRMEDGTDGLDPMVMQQAYLCTTMLDLGHEVDKSKRTSMLHTKDRILPYQYVTEQSRSSLTKRILRTSTVAVDYQLEDDAAIVHAELKNEAKQRGPLKSAFPARSGSVISWDDFGRQPSRATLDGGVFSDESGSS